MPANVENMFSVREMPWHRQGTVVDDYPQNWDEARKLAGLDWEPMEESVYALDGINQDGREIYAELDDFKRVVRSDTHATLAVKRNSYEIINHTAFGEIFEGILQQDNVKAETGGCLEGGRRVWMLCRLDEPILLPGDETVTMPYLGLTSRHDGTGATTLRATAVRIVCANTFSASELEGERTGLTYSFIHRGNWRDHVTDAREAVTGARREIAEYVEVAEHLLSVPVTPKQTRTFVNLFVPMPPEGLVTPRVQNNVTSARNQLTGLIKGRTVAGAGIDGTAYGLVQGAGEYLDHVRASNSWETRLRRTLMRPEPLKARARKLALEVAHS